MHRFAKPACGVFLAPRVRIPPSPFPDRGSTQAVESLLLAFLFSASAPSLVRRLPYPPPGGKVRSQTAAKFIKEGRPSIIEPVDNLEESVHHKTDLLALGYLS